MNREQLERARATREGVTPLGKNLGEKFKSLMSKISRPTTKRKPGDNTYQEKFSLQSFSNAFKNARKAGKKTFMFKGKEFTTKTGDEAVSAFQKLIARYGSSPEQVEKAAREIRVSHGIPHPKKKKKK